MPCHLRLFKLTFVLCAASFPVFSAAQTHQGSAHQDRVRLSEDVSLTTASGLPCFKIQTDLATFYLEKSGCGLAAMIDGDGNDWIGFNPQPGSRSSGEFRGFPNAVHRQAGSYFHPRNANTGHSNARVVVTHPDHVAIECSSENGLWGCRYDFYPTHCTFTMTRMAEGYKYWALYEGTPGGKYDSGDWWITSAISQPQPLSKNHEGDIPSPEWIAFGDASLNRVLFLLHHEDDHRPDRYYGMNEQMTVFGFGRSTGGKLLDSVPQRFSIGFIESKDANVIAAAIRQQVATTDDEASAGGTSAVVKVVDWNFPEIIVDPNPVTRRSTDIELADIDLDGRPDLWVSGHPQSWYRNTGRAGSWQRLNTFSGRALGGTLADVDGDGDMDVVTAKGRGDAPLVWLENPVRPAGDARRGPWTEHLIAEDLEDPDEPHSNYIGPSGRKSWHLDLNGDGRDDLVYAAFKRTLWYMPSPEGPAGGEAAWKRYKIASHSASHGGCAVVDINGDGQLDIVWGTSWYEFVGTPEQHNWTAHRFTTQWTDEAQVEAGDIDGDGLLDIVLTGEEDSQGVAWFRNPGLLKTAEWEKTQAVAQWKGLHSLELADFDHDGDLDILTAQMHGRPGQRVAILENDQSGQQWQEHILATCGSHKATVGDVDGDGDLDVIGKNYAEDVRPRIWLNPNQPQAPRPLSLDNWQRHVIDEHNPSRSIIFAGDLDGDGFADVSTGPKWYKSSSHIGDFEIREFGHPGMALGMYDFDRDGDLDVIFSNWKWARNDGRGNFQLLDNIAGTGRKGVQGAKIGVFQRGRIEIVYTHYNGDVLNMITVPDNPGQAEWPNRTLYDWEGRSKGVDIGDIDRDGDIDIVFCGRDWPTMSWLRNDSNSWSAHVFSDAPPLNVVNHRCHLGDLDGDGRLDIVVGHHHATLLTWYRQPDDPTGPWKKHVVDDGAMLDEEPMSIDIADMDCDGDNDLIIGEHGKAALCGLYVFENQNNGTRWIPHLVHEGDDHHIGAQVCDLDNDGDLDIMSIGYKDTKVMVYENLASSQLAGPTDER